MKNNDQYKTGRRAFLSKSITFGLASALSLNAASANDTEKDSFEFATDEKGLTIVFHGDSITDGARGRSSDPNHIMGHGYVFSIVSRVGADFPQSKLMFYNRGVGSTKLSDLKMRWQTDALDLKPDVLSILMGVMILTLMYETLPKVTTLINLRRTTGKCYLRLNSKTPILFW